MDVNGSARAATLEVAIELKNGELVTRQIQNIGAAGEASGKRAAIGLNAISPALDRILALSAEVFAAHKVIEYADSMTRLQGQLSLVTHGTEQLAQVQNQLFDVAQRTRQSYESVGDLYARVTRSTRDLGLSQTALVDVTEAVSRAVLISNVSTQTAQNGMYQLSQAFAAGRLQGQDFKAVIEDIPRLGTAIADGLGVSIGKLREMSQAGEITSAKLVEALEKSNTQLTAESARMPATIGQSFVILENALAKYIGQENAAFGVTSTFAAGMKELAEHLDLLSDAAIAVAAVYASKLVASSAQYLVSLGAEMAAAQSARVAEIARAEQAAATATIERAIAVERLRDTVTDMRSLQERAAAINVVTAANVRLAESEEAVSVATAAMSVSARAATAASSAFSAILAPIGGPVGAAIIAAVLAIRYAFDQEGEGARTAASDIEKYQSALGKLNADQRATQLEANKTALALETAYKVGLQHQISALPKAGSAGYDVGETPQQAADLAAKVNEATASIAALNAMIGNTTDVTKQSADAENHRQQVYKATLDQRDEELQKQTALNGAFGQSDLALAKLEVAYDAAIQHSKDSKEYKGAELAALDKLTYGMAAQKTMALELAEAQKIADDARTSATANAATIQAAKDASALADATSAVTNAQLLGAAAGVQASAVLDHLRNALDATAKSTAAYAAFQDVAAHGSAAQIQAAYDEYEGKLRTIAVDKDLRDATIDRVAAQQKSIAAGKDALDLMGKVSAEGEKNKAKAKANIDYLADQVKQAIGIDNAWTSGIEKIITDGTKSFADFFEDVLRMFDDLIKKMQADGKGDSLGAKLLGVGSAAIGAGFAGYNIGQATGDAGAGIFGGAASGAFAGNSILPGGIGAAIGGLAGAAGGLLGAAEAHKEAAKALQQAADAFNSSLVSAQASVYGGEFTPKAQQIQSDAGMQTLRDQLDAVTKAKINGVGRNPGDTNASIQADYQNKLNAIDVLEKERDKQIQEQWEALKQSSLDNSQARILAATGQSDAAALLQKQISDTKELADAIQQFHDGSAQVVAIQKAQAAEVDALKKAQAEAHTQQQEDLAVRMLAATGTAYQVDQMKQEVAWRRELAAATDDTTRAQIEAVQAAEAAYQVAQHQKLIDDTNASLAVRAANATGQTDLGARLQQQIDQAAELYNAQQSGLDAATLANIAYVQGLEQVALAAQQAENALQATISGIKQQAEVFGETSDDVLAQEAAAYGFAGLTLDQIKALYTKYTPGVDLTQDQQTENAHVAQYVSDYMAAQQSTSSVSAATSQAAVQATTQIQKDIGGLTQTTGSRMADYLATEVIYARDSRDYLASLVDLLSDGSAGSRFAGGNSRAPVETTTVTGSTTVTVQMYGNVTVQNPAGLSNASDAFAKQVAEKVDKILSAQYRRAKLSGSPNRNN